MKVTRTLLVVATILATLSTQSPTAGAAVQFVGGKLPKAKGTVNAEPGIAADGRGTFYIIAQAADPNDPLETGHAALWRSTNNGRSYRSVPSPFDVPGTGRSLPFAGSDVDIAAASEPNALGSYNVYAAALGFTRTQIALAYSPDAGDHWITLPTAVVPATQLDRPWLAASGPCTVHLAYLALWADPIGIVPPFFGWFMNTYDVCGPGGAISSITGVQMLTPDTFTFSGKFGVDASSKSRYRGSLYVPMEKCRPGGIDLNKYNYCLGGKEIFVSYSRDGTSWTRRHIADIPRGALESWNGTIATSSTGRVYIAWFDNKDVYFSSSSNGGRTWSPAKRVNAAPSLTAVYPTMAAIGRSTVEISWYGTDREGDANDGRAMGRAGGKTSAPWRVYWARSTNGGAAFTQQPVSPIVHMGRLCTLGGECDNAKDAPYNNGLLDDFTMTISPRTGRASIAYTTDRPTGSLNDASSGYATQL